MIMMVRNVNNIATTSLEHSILRLVAQYERSGLCVGFGAKGGDVDRR